MAEVLSFGRDHVRSFAVDGDENQIIHIDTTDTGILARWAQVENDLTDTLSQVDKLGEVEGETEQEKAANMSRRFDEIEKRAREQIDALFNTNVSGPVCAKYGSLIRTVNGEPLILTVLETLLGFYGEDIRKDMEKAKRHIEKHTKKYAK